ncbi:uncharacterized protein EKO05_0007587 [Ascochyta rabiei]|uniref:Uncharacterized protein n=1 Tax=Didymella rabiei TaxID=5454 RepID=A0A163LZG3_DIDRA|nr:uncharacterized protein EKO05_0007587 [Ascochyta rabiei]KZM28260.1 hypothetical protein ST47_g592 [Ascochyta rabiei]UPX17220.1 hypothetical protein EKO05_0007587 [Ascochyta rabiei]
MSSHEKLSAASNDRKARLAQLKSLKRKQAPDDRSPDDDAATTTAAPASALTTTASTPSTTTTYLSGRNFDPETRNVRLGFEKTPIADATATLEYKAAQLALQTKQAQEQEQSDAPLDLFKLAPKKANWDLKRDLEAKMKEGGLQRATENALARLVRERVEAQRLAREKAGEEALEGGLEGGELVEAMHVREVEEERERRRDAEEEEVVEG